MTPDDPRHGTTPGFHQGCRCTSCRTALARDEKARRLDSLRGGRAVPAYKMQRRIQALMALGWSSEQIAHHAGFRNRNRVLQVLNGQDGRPCTWVERRTAQRVVAVFELLSMKRPDGRYAVRTRNVAARKGWVPPLGWDDIDDPDESPNLGGTDNHVDPVVVLRVLQGDRINSATNAERCAIVARWHETGRPYNDLERQTGWQVWRYRTKEEATA